MNIEGQNKIVSVILEYIFVSPCNRVRVSLLLFCNKVRVILTNAFSKKMENHCYAIALHFVYYNFGKIHKTLRVTPAMEAGLCKDVMSIEDIVRLAD